MLPVSRRDVPPGLRCLPIREQGAELIAREDKEGRAHLACLLAEPPHEFIGHVLRRDDRGGPKGVEAAQRFAILPILAGAAIGIRATFEDAEVVAPVVNPFVQHGVGRKRVRVAVEIDKAMRLPAYERDAFLFGILLDEGVAQLVSKEI